MMLSKQLSILQTLTALIETVTPANGYDYDLTGKVFRGRTAFGAETVPPFVSILEAPKPPESLSVTQSQVVRSVDWALLLQGWAVDDKDNPLDPAYGLKAAVEQVLSRMTAQTNQGLPLFPAFYMLGRQIMGARIGPGVCRPPADVSSQAFFYLPVTIVFEENTALPFVTT